MKWTIKCTNTIQAYILSSKNQILLNFDGSCTFLYGDPNILSLTYEKFDFYQFKDF